MTVAARFQNGVLLPLVGLGRCHDKGKIPVLIPGPQPLKEFEPVHLGHVPVAEHQFSPLVLELLDGVGTVDRHDDIVEPGFVQHLFGHDTHGPGVVDNKDFHFGIHCHNNAPYRFMTYN